MSDEAASTLQAVSSHPLPLFCPQQLFLIGASPMLGRTTVRSPKKKKKTSCPVFVFIAKTAVKHD